jgi:hypothetical protein
VNDRLIQIEADKFADYWTSKPGQGGIKLDWRKTWCNWCRTAFSRSFIGDAAQTNSGGDTDRTAYLDQLQGARSLEA